MSGLPGVARIALLDRDRVQQPAAAHPEAVRVDDARYARGLQLAEQQRRPQVLAVTVGLVRRLVRWDTEDDRIVPVVDGLDVEHRLGALARGVVPGPLAERAFGQRLVVVEEAREHDLRRRRHGQPGDRLGDDRIRLAADPAGPVVLARALRHFERRRDEQERVHAAHDEDRAGLLALEVRVAELAAVLAGRDVHADAFAVVDHHPVGAEVDPVRVGVLQDVDDAGAQVAAAVQRVPLRGGEFQDVHGVAAQHVLHHRTVAHDPRRERPALLGELEETVHERAPFDVDRQAERQGEALAGRVRVREDPESGRIAGDVVEQHGGGVIGVMEHLGDASDVLFPGRAAHIAELAQVADALDPVAQIAVFHEAPSA